eukprot:CAMPEP_0174304692 /NCGR_PEP_ID=MMETSP0809-20121228/60937_1 /TAXON_ID=73025 ORGANISM="Eutreptiella gymnastica-like, Strain CCMP1594" /NCGR_SAMPLE_ID=MMETSP0809 /ASSEMBLY_ACC=CAM_ASM_000658 /LENGTH=129 /DNA_ID=CAMNT_0015410969 /DNA_START=29 /DNA_END=418 /DNA_ORIENTATION=+
MSRIAFRGARLLLKRRSHWFEEYKWGQNGNRWSPLRMLPDWEYADGNPAPISNRFKKKLRQMAVMKAQVLLAAESANRYAAEGKLPSKPAIKRQRINDVLVTDVTPEEIWEEKKAAILKGKTDDAKLVP